MRNLGYTLQRIKEWCSGVCRYVKMRFAPALNPMWSFISGNFYSNKLACKRSTVASSREFISLIIIIIIYVAF